MAIRSMTGFARADGRGAGLSWHWEVKTVNGRGLDVRLRMPPGFDSLEQPVRDACQKRLGRGACTVTLNIEQETTGSEIRLNEAVLLQVAAALDRAAELCKAAPATLDGILAIRGVLEQREPQLDEAALEVRNALLLASLNNALDGGVEARIREGTRIAATLESQIAEIALLTREAEGSPQRTPERIAQRLKEQVERLFQNVPQLDPDRLHQEAMLIATRADIAEELQRLNSHVAAARELMAETAPAGRKLDFLAQELNREANTLCSKANDAELTRVGLKLKAVIDQLREQVQNIE